MARGYNADDVQQILQRAMSLKQADEFSREQLLEMAAEVNVAPDLLQQAEQDWLQQRESLQQKQADQQRRRYGFRAHLIPFVAVNACLIVLNVVTSPSHPWSLYPLLGWGLGLTLHGTSLSQPGGTYIKRVSCTR